MFASFKVAEALLEAARVWRVIDLQARSDRRFNFNSSGNNSWIVLDHFDPTFDTATIRTGPLPWRTARLRRDHPPVVDGKIDGKYLRPAKVPRRLYFVPGKAAVGLKAEVDAIVNAANKRLAGSVVDVAVHEEGGPSIMEELKRRFPRGCSTGDAVVTGAGALRAKFVIHAVGPGYDPREQEWCADRLRKTCLRSFQLAAELGYRSIALPSISTSVFRYPTADAARIALRTASDFLLTTSPLELVRWVLFDDRTFDAFADAAEEVLGDLARQD
jgi:O-acetyl-ADP-ribose deacetylase (regulator of RNase III)